MLTLVLILFGYAVLGIFTDSIEMLLLTTPVVHSAMMALDGGRAFGQSFRRLTCRGALRDLVRHPCDQDGRLPGCRRPEHHSDDGGACHCGCHRRPGRWQPGSGRPETAFGQSSLMNRIVLSFGHGQRGGVIRAGGKPEERGPENHHSNSHQCGVAVGLFLLGTGQGTDLRHQLRSFADQLFATEMLIGGG